MEDLRATFSKNKAKSHFATENRFLSYFAYNKVLVKLETRYGLFSPDCALFSKKMRKAILRRSKSQEISICNRTTCCPVWK